MSWKLPDIIQKSMDTIKPDRNRKVNTTGNPLSLSPVVCDDEDDLGITHVQHQGTIPFRRVESAVHNFVNVALPADLDRLHRHKCNITKLQKTKDVRKLQVEYENAGITVKQLKRNVYEMETLRTRVIKEDLHVFDKHLTPAKTKALAAVQEFLKIQANEQLSADVEIPNLLNLESVASCSYSVEYRPHKLLPENLSLDDKISDKRFVQLKGNQLVIESASPQDLRDRKVASERSEHQPENNNSSPPMIHQEQLQLAVEQKLQADESWEKLQRDTVELREIMKEFSSAVHHQGKMVDDISGNIETASENIQEGTAQLKKSSLIKAAMFPVVGAVLGGVIGGPIGMVAGLKLGSVTTGFAAIGVTGTVVGYQGGKVLKKRQQDVNSFEMLELHKKDETDTDDSYEFLGNT